MSPEDCVHSGAVFCFDCCYDSYKRALAEIARLKADNESKDAKIREFIFAFDEPPTYIESERYLNAIRELRSEVEG